MAFDPLLGLGQNRSADDSFQRLTYGGYLMRQGLSQACRRASRRFARWKGSCCSTSATPTPSRTAASFIRPCWNEADVAMNRAAFAENGYSKGVFYNMYCNARTTLSDGRVYVFGGHDMQSDKACTRSTSSTRTAKRG